jgi:hypothetical protein
LNYLNCQYDAGFSSLRMEHWKNFVRWESAFSHSMLS